MACCKNKQERRDKPSGREKGWIMARKNLKEARKAAGFTQQQMADKLGICIRHYKYIESGEVLGAIWIWDKLEDITGIHQRILREISDSHPDKGENPLKH